MTPASTPRVRARQAAMTPYNRVNAIKDLHPSLQDIIKNCPALDIIFDHDNPRSSTHSRGRGRDKEHVARPPNAFMVYRSYVWFTKQLEDNDEKNLSCVSRLAGRSWMILSERDRAPFKQVADIAKREHSERNPDYKYAPSSRSQKSQKNPARRASGIKEKAKVKETATVRYRGFEALPPSKEVTPIPTGTPLTAAVDTPPPSSEISSSSPSSSSPSSPFTSPAPTFRQWGVLPSPPSPQLQYPWDPNLNLPNYPPRPRFRPVTSGLIPSPSMSVLQLNDVQTPSILDELPDKYKEAESFHDLLPEALAFHEPVSFDGPDPNSQIAAPARAPIDYTGFISGNPEVKLGSPIPNHSSIGGYFSPGPSTTTAIDDDFNASYSTAVHWSMFDMPTLNFDDIMNEHIVYGPNDGELFDAIITCGSY